MNLETTYMGLTLTSPVVVGASHMTGTLKTLKELEKRGAGAVVIKSLFEEEIQYMNLMAEDTKQEFEERHAEMISVFPHFEPFGPERHLQFVKEAKNALTIPVIGSLNCIDPEVWVSYAEKMAKTGVDALELNLYQTPSDFDQSSIEIETEQLDMLKTLRSKVDIPISVKLSEQYTAPLHFIRSIEAIGIDGFVLYNRRFLPDINIYDIALKYPFNLSSAMDYRASLQTVGQLYGHIDGSLIGSNGVLTAYDVIRMLLAGADAVQMVSAIYKNGLSYIQEVLDELDAWMEKQGFERVEDFRGRLSKKACKSPLAYERGQYIDLLTDQEKLLKDYQV